MLVACGTCFITILAIPYGGCQKLVPSCGPQNGRAVLGRTPRKGRLSFETPPCSSSVDNKIGDRPPSKFLDSHNEASFTMIRIVGPQRILDRDSVTVPFGGFILGCTSFGFIGGIVDSISYAFMDL